MSAPLHTTPLAGARNRAPVALVAALARLARLPFLFGGLVYNALGATLAWYGGALPHWSALVLSQICITSAQLMTHGTNDYFDQAADRAHPRTPRWSGGSRVLVRGDLPAAWALGAAVAAGAVAIVAALALGTFAARAGLMALVGVFLAWSYSSPPLRLHSRGVGEVAGALLLAVITPLVSYLGQGGAAPGAAALALAPLASLQMAMLIAVSLPDLEGDRAAGKRTLAVRVRGARAGRVAAAASLAPSALWLSALLPTAGRTPTAAALVLAAITLWTPLALWQARRLWCGHGLLPGTWDGVALGSIGLVMGCATTAVVGLLIAGQRWV